MSVALFHGSGFTSRNDKALSNSQLFRIIDAFAVGGEKRFPSRGRTIKPARNRGERIARLHDIGSRRGFVLSAFWRLLAAPEPSGGGSILCHRFVRQPRFRSPLFQFLSQIEIFVS